MRRLSFWSVSLVPFLVKSCMISLYFSDKKNSCRAGHNRSCSWRFRGQQLSVPRGHIIFPPWRKAGWHRCREAANSWCYERRNAGDRASKTWPFAVHSEWIKWFKVLSSSDINIKQQTPHSGFGYSGQKVVDSAFWPVRPALFYHRWIRPGWRRAWRNGCPETLNADANVIRILKMARGWKKYFDK